ncbi:uncharacterized protein TNCV_211831 [Trichonephila clavipes]|uniref:Uncharacterized protein n=1 Tax=Trichonephila clavipes TaxID=2585209 RepID=A0A8X6SYL4_TRICX|nr:uncharacterized protein TNCV_211831 [Trichonephila clavipes]
MNASLKKWAHKPSYLLAYNARFKPKFEGSYRVSDVKNSNVVIWNAGKSLTINVDQVRIYRHRKCDETETKSGSSDSSSLRDESRGFDRVQRISNESQDGKKKGSEVKRELEEKGLNFKNDQGDKHTNKNNNRGPLIRSIPSSWSEKSRMIESSKIERKKSRRAETVAPTASGYNLRPRIGKREESRRTIERKTQQGDQFDPEKAEEGTIAPTSKSEQDQATRMPDEEVINNVKTRKGERSVYEKVFIPGGLGRKRQIQVIRTRLYRFFLYSFEQVVGRVIAMKQVTVR